MDDKKQSRIIFSREFEGYDQANWPEMISWLSEHINRLQKAFQPHLIDLGRSIRSSYDEFEDENNVEEEYEG